MKKKTVGIIGTNGVPGKYGGWDQLVIHLTMYLKDRFNIVVYTPYNEAVPGMKEYNGAVIKVINFKANGSQSIPYDIVSMIHAGIHCDVLFICGVSGCIALPIIRLFRKKIVLNPDGQEWKRGKWSKPIKIFLRLSEYLGVKFANDVVADNLKIQDYIQEEYNKDSHLIEYGGDHVVQVKLKKETADKYDVENNNYAFKVCRIVPENNIDLILNAFSKRPDKKLILVGNWSFSNYGISIRQNFSEFKNLILLDPIFDQEILDELRCNCSIYIHGHSVGGTNPSLVEAMHLGLFIAAFNVDYNVETTDGGALYFSNENDLLEIIDNYDTLDVESYKSKMLSISKRRYLWSDITEKYAKVFED